MSCYNWEHGTIQLPKSKYAAIRKQFMEGYNAFLLDQLERSKRLREHVLTVNKGKRNVQWFYALQDHMNRFGVDWSTVEKMIQGMDGKKPRNLNKKLMELANNKTTVFDLAGEGTISFNKERKTVTYDVPENNRSVERARESKVGELFFKTMNSVTWTRGSGGMLIGNDEYNRENQNAGGGGNYMTASFGKDGKKDWDMW